MASFLITFRPASESPEHGFPLEELQNLVRRLRDGDTTEVRWRFRNNHATPGERVFLLVQGRLGPAIIGYGRVNSNHETGTSGTPVVSIKFEKLVDPSTEQVLASKDTLLAIKRSEWIWRTPFSGRLLGDGVAADLEKFVVGKTPATDSGSSENTGVGPRGAAGGWPCAPDAAHNANVEAAAIAFVRSWLGEETRDRQRDNCGWDLECTQVGRSLCVEVKGLSGSALAVELSPNEYAAMKRAMNESFSEGQYRLAIVRNALTAPELFLFAHGSGTDWICELTSTHISVAERIAARLSEV